MDKYDLNKQRGYHYNRYQRIIITCEKCHKSYGTRYEYSACPFCGHRNYHEDPLVTLIRLGGKWIWEKISGKKN